VFLSELVESIHSAESSFGHGKENGLIPVFVWISQKFDPRLTDKVVFCASFGVTFEYRRLIGTVKDDDHRSFRQLSVDCMQQNELVGGFWRCTGVVTSFDPY
jgi:hypothetical protein